MFQRKKPETESDLDKAIHDAHAYLAGADESTDEYKQMVDNLSKLYKMKESNETPNRVSKDAIVAAAASVGSIVLILLFEGVGRGIVTSKSIGFVQKPRI